MRPLDACPTHTLEWRRDAGPDGFSLCSGEETFATLTFRDDARLLARVETAEGTWTLKHLGVLNPVVTLREEGEKVNLATFHAHAFRHGQLVFTDGAAFDWTWHHGMGPGGTFTDPGGLPLVRLFAHMGRDLASRQEIVQGDVDLNPAQGSRLRHAVLAAFGWYLILFDHLKERDAAAAETALRM